MKIKRENWTWKKKSGSEKSKVNCGNSESKMDGS